MTALSDEDVRTRILNDLHNRRRQRLEILTAPQEYAQALGISEESANFNIQYLIEARLVRGLSAGSMGTTRRESHIIDITPLGVDVVEGRSRRNLDINYSIINVNAPVLQSQIAAGNNVSQTQTITVNNLTELEQYLDRSFSAQQVAELKSLIREIESDANQDSVSPSKLRRIKTLVGVLGTQAATIVIQFILKHYLGLG
jgi:hypothetical protein